MLNFPETADIETSSDDYVSRFTGEIGAWLLQVQEVATLQMLAAYPNAKILDVGGGHGQITSALVENGYQVTVLGSADICKTRIQNLLDRDLCSFQVGNILELPYLDRTFDIVISYRLLPHVTQWQQFLSQLARVARQAVIIDYPAVNSVNFIAPYLFQLKKNVEGNTRPFTCFKESQLLEVFQPLSFSPSDRYPQFFLPIVLHRMMKSPKLSSILESFWRQLGMTSLYGSPVILKVVRDTK